MVVDDLSLEPKLMGADKDFRPCPIRVEIERDWPASGKCKSSLRSVPSRTNSGKVVSPFADAGSLVTCLTNSAIERYAYFAWQGQKRGSYKQRDT